MKLHEYPRPPDDTGIGIHWSPSYATAAGMNQIRDYWLPEMKALGIKWVKIYNHDGALDFVELLLAEGFMPIVRLYQPSPNPSRLGVREIVHLDAYRRLGVHYFEFNHEPDLDLEWKGGRVPENGIDLVVENTIANLEIILERGGMPAIPAVSNGCSWDLVGKIVEAGHKDLLQGPVWQAIHNYAYNRPLDYPHDSGNQEGTPYTYRFYQALLDEQWGEDAWRGRTLDIVNRDRFEQRKFGTTLAEENACWLAYEYFDSRNQSHLGKSIPILSTECGYLVSEESDPRYPATSPHLHMAQTLEACRIMMGTSQRFAPAPDYYFCASFWVLANAKLGSKSAWWEGHAWYSDRWPGACLPIVQALRNEPKRVRLWEDGATIGSLATLRGIVAHATDDAVVLLAQEQQEIARTTLDAHSCYTFTKLNPGTYTVQLAQTDLVQTVDLQPGQGQITLNFDLSQQQTDDTRHAESSVMGHVRGGAGATVALLQRGTGREWVAVARQDGTYRFENLAAGEYSVRVHPNGSHLNQLELDGWNPQTVDLSKAGWGYTVSEMPPENISPEHTQSLLVTHIPGTTYVIYCRVEDQSHATVRARQSDWQSPSVTLGNVPALADDMAILAGLSPGAYQVVVDGIVDDRGLPIYLEAQVHLDSQQVPLIEFVYSPPATEEAPQQSVIRGRIIGALDAYVGPPLRLLLLDQKAGRRDLQAEPGHSLIFGVAPGAAGKIAKLIDRVGNETQQVVNEEDRFRFEFLTTGYYNLTVAEGYQENDLFVDGRSGWDIFLTPPSATWTAEVSAAGSMPGFGAVRVEVQGQAGQPVHIWKEDWDGMTLLTGSNPEQGEFSLEFSPLEAGEYMVEAIGLDIWADVELTGLEAVWVNFYQKHQPLQPNVVRALTESELAGPKPIIDEAVQEVANIQRERHYLFIEESLDLAQVIQDRDGLLDLLRYVARHQPEIGSSILDASKADQVLFLGDEGSRI